MFGKKLSAAGMLCRLMYFDFDPLIKSVVPSQLISPGCARKKEEEDGACQQRLGGEGRGKTNLERKVADSRDGSLEVLER